MVDQRFYAPGNISAYWAPLNYSATPWQPTVAEATAAGVVQLTRAISFSDTDFGTQASNTTSSQAWSDGSAVDERGAAQFGGTFSFFYPSNYADISSDYAKAYTALGTARTEGYIIIRLDRDYNKAAANTALAAGQIVNIYKVMTTAYSPQIVGEDAFRQNVSFTPRGSVYLNRVLGATATPTITLTGPSTLSSGSALVRPTVNGRMWLGAVTFSSSAPANVSVSPSGVITRGAAGAATITGTDVLTGATGTLAITA